MGIPFTQACSLGVNPRSVTRGLSLSAVQAKSPLWKGFLHKERPSVMPSTWQEHGRSLVALPRSQSLRGDGSQGQQQSSPSGATQRRASQHPSPVWLGRSSQCPAGRDCGRYPGQSLLGLSLVTKTSEHNSDSFLSAWREIECDARKEEH